MTAVRHARRFRIAHSAGSLHDGASSVLTRCKVSWIGERDGNLANYRNVRGKWSYVRPKAETERPIVYILYTCIQRSF